MKRFFLLVACAIVAIFFLKGRAPSEPSPSVESAETALAAQETVSLPAPREPVAVPPVHKTAEANLAPVHKPNPAAKAALEEALKKDPENSELLAQMGFLYLNEKQPRKALEYFEKSLDRDASNAEVVSAAGSIYLNERLFKRGTEFLAQLRERNPENTTITVAMADMLAKEGRPVEGMEALEETGASPYLGMMYLNNGRTGQAVEVFKKLLETRETAPGTDPMAVEMARLDLANAVLAHGNPQEAERIVRGVIERNPGEPNAKELWARVQQAGAAPADDSQKVTTF